jgi:hypothetical protein
MSEVKGEKRTNAGPTDPGLVIETERQPLVDAFGKIYNKYQEEMHRQALCEHVYGILFVLMQRPDLMQSPGNRFYVSREGGVRLIDSSSNGISRAVELVPVQTNAEFEGLKQRLQTNLENLKRREQQLMAEPDRYHLVEEKMLSTVKDFPDDSDVKQSVLRYLNDLKADLLLSQEELQRLLENQNQVVKKAELAKEIGNWLLDQIEQGNSTKKKKATLTGRIGDWLSRLRGIRKKNST